jgi:uncharacterized protein (DUF934 family)
MPASPTLDLYRVDQFVAPEAAHERLTLTNDADPRQADLTGIRVVELSFPRFVDGRAFSQASLLRRRLGFTGVIRATGDVLVDQLLQMQRTGFSEAVLRDDQDIEHGRRLLGLFPGFYQGDAAGNPPHFAATAA